MSSINSKIKVGVIGGGIIGTTSAIVLIESYPNIDITLISEKFTQDTISDGSGGVIYPGQPGNTCPQRASKWVSTTVKYITKYFMSTDARELGIGLISVYILFAHNESHEIPETAQEMISCRDMTKSELNLFGNQWKSGLFVTTYYAEPNKMLPFFLKQFKCKGGKVIQQKVNSLNELVGQFDIVINCSGVYASQLVNDPKVKPIRGQVFRVRAPWIKHCVFTMHNYVIPNSDSVVLGKTENYDDWNLDVNPNDSRNIMEGCCQLFPSLRSAQIIKEWVGLRPGRDEVRLESELIDKMGKTMHVIHNYGHGSLGVTLSWGCATEVQEIVTKIIDKNFIKLANY